MRGTLKHSSVQSRISSTPIAVATTQAGGDNKLDAESGSVELA